MPKTQSQLQADLEAIEEVLNSGVTQVDVDGTRTQYDLDAMRQRASELRRKIRAMAMKRPRAANFDLGGF